MKIYLYNNNMTEQSVRQMMTVVPYLKYDELYLNSSWENEIEFDKSIKFMKIEDFMNLNEKKSIIFFNIIDGYKLKKFKKHNNFIFIFRPRGVVPEESYYKNKNFLKKLLLNLIEKKVIKVTNSFIFLNGAQKNHFIDKYPAYRDKFKSSFILPNVKNIQLKEIKETKKNKLKIVYSGGFSQWQNIDLIFYIITEIINESQIEIVFTVLTFENNFQKAKEYAEKYKIKNNLSVKYISPNKIDEELEKHDLGIIIRDENIINKTASPFKIIDYVYNGLGLIITDNLINQVENVLDEDLFFTVKLSRNKLFYSKSELNNFIYNFKKDSMKKEIIAQYNNFLASIKIINLDI